jgi:GntR family transcriptional regulator/MocR family aminotransferase
MALAGRGIHRVGFEDPGYDETGRIAAELAGVTMVPIPIDDDGIVVSALHEADVGAVVLTPAHQWPTGVVMSAERRRGVAEWAVSTGGYVVEDDYDAEFRYDHEPIGALQGLAPSRVISISTASKALAPTVRLGWMLCPPDLVADIADLKGRTDRGSPGIDQLVLARLIESGRYDRHLRKMRREYARRRDALVEALAVHAPEVRVSGLAAGFHAIAHLPPGCTEAGAIAGAQAVSVGFHGLSANRSDRSVDPPALVLGFGDLDVEAIREGIAWAAPALRARP